MGTPTKRPFRTRRARACAAADTTATCARRIVDIFFSKNVTHLPVIDRQNILSGIISVRDLLRPHWAGGQ